MANNPIIRKIKAIKGDSSGQVNTIVTYDIGSEAKNVKYTVKTNPETGNTTQVSVKDALDELYQESPSGESSVINKIASQQQGFLRNVYFIYQISNNKEIFYLTAINCQDLTFSEIAISTDNNNVFTKENISISEQDYRHIITFSTKEQSITADGIKNISVTFSNNNSYYFKNNNEFTKNLTFTTASIQNNPQKQIWIKNQEKINLFNSNFVDLIYPIGSIYISTKNCSPSYIFGGTWSQIQDCFLYARREPYPLIPGGISQFQPKGTGGTKDAIIVEHTHTGTTNTDGAHEHPLEQRFQISNNNDGSNTAYQTPTGKVKYHYGKANKTGKVNGETVSSKHNHKFTTDKKGVDGTNKNMPPYLVVYMWERIS